MMDSLANRQSPTASGFALRFFHVLLLVFTIAACLATALITLLPIFHQTERISLPWPFWISSGFLLTSSLMQHRAIQAVRRERQQLFRKRLFFALIAGVGFVSVQAFGLWGLLQMQPRTAEAASTGPEAFVFVMAVLHALHVSLAIMLLTYVFLKSRMDRYDHEYYWGPTFCGWFWHALGMVWVAIVFVFLIAT
jgi:cytochrome c oxidase subunit 3